MSYSNVQISIVLAMKIGSGILFVPLPSLSTFSLADHPSSSSPGVIVAETHSVGASLIVWLISGILGWTGASSFAELGSAIPLNGGAQAYLAYAYNPLVSYLFAWTYITALNPGGKGVIALIFAEYVNRLLWHATSGDSSPDLIPDWSIKLTACLAVAFATVLCIATKNLGTRAAVVLTSIKVSAHKFYPQCLTLIFSYSLVGCITCKHADGHKTDYILTPVRFSLQYLASSSSLVAKLQSRSGNRYLKIRATVHLHMLWHFIPVYGRSMAGTKRITSEAK